MLLIGQSCDINGKKHYSFQDISKILDKNSCNSCHFDGSLQSKWNYNTYDQLTILNHCGDRIINFGQPSRSVLIDKLNSGPTQCGNAMPLGGKSVSSQDLLAIESWISFGAPEYCLPLYEEIVQIFEASQCQSCHSNGDSWQFKTYQDVFEKPTASICTDPIVVKYDAEQSLLYKKMKSGQSNLCGDQTFATNHKISAEKLAMIRDWINAGAPEVARALPVSLVKWSSSVENNQLVILTWESETEINHSHFEIEYSYDGLSFEVLGSKAALGNGSEYQFIHSTTTIGYNYYRLKMVDFDNSFRYSPIRVEKLNTTDEIFTYFPSPVLKGNSFSVQWYPIDGREKANLILLDITGKKMAQYVINNGLNQLQMMDIRPGLYYISLENYNAQNMIKKLVVIDY